MYKVKADPAFFIGCLRFGIWEFTEGDSQKKIESKRNMLANRATPHGNTFSRTCLQIGL